MYNYIHISKGGFLNICSPPTYFWSFNVSKKNRIQDVNASLFGRLIERKLGGDGCLGSGMRAKKLHVFMAIFVPATGDWKLLTFLERAFFFWCNDVEFEFLKIPMKHTDGQHLANQLVWF